MDKDAHRLYDLIRNQFIACQMTPAQYTSTTVTVTAGEYELKAKGRILRFDGYTRVLTPMGRKGEDTILPDMQKGEVLAVQELLPAQHFTKPPARYSEASLVKELEKRGIGRPSTYASIISTIQERGYVRVENRRFFAEKMGDIVTDRLVQSFNSLMNYSFTAQMEEELDDIAQGEKDWIKVLDDFYSDFSNTLTVAESEDGGMAPNEPTPTDIACPTCGHQCKSVLPVPACFYLVQVMPCHRKSAAKPPLT
jgi:DNA topoisomerase-1